MYHSYYEVTNGTLDISNDMFYEGNSFNEVYNPEEYSKIKVSEFSRAYEKMLEDENIHDDGVLAPALALAINNKI